MLFLLCLRLACALQVLRAQPQLKQIQYNAVGHANAIGRSLFCLGVVRPYHIAVILRESQFLACSSKLVERGGRGTRRRGELSHPNGNDPIGQKKQK